MAQFFRVDGLSWTLRALRSKNYRIFFIGQSVSLVGTWMQQVALGWLVYSLSNSAFWLGVVGFSGQIPTFILSPFAGVLADRWDRRRILLVTQTLAMTQAIVLALLVFSGTAALWNILPLAMLLGCVHAFDIPARQAFLTQMIQQKEDLANAIALNSSMFHGARLVGPSLAGLLIAAVGEGTCFLLNGISFLAVLGALLALDISPQHRRGFPQQFLKEIREGFAYAFGAEPMRYLLLLIALLSFMGMPYAVLMPIFAKKILHGGPATLGFLVGASGLGALSGAMYLASRRSVRGLGRIIAVAAGLFGLGLMGLSLCRFFWIALLLMFLTGCGMMVGMASCNTVLQTLCDDDKRGRVMSLYTMAFMGMAPLGSLLAGVLASWLGVPPTLFLGGLACLAGALGFSILLPSWRQGRAYRSHRSSALDKMEFML